MIDMKRLLSFAGPGFLVAIGYLDPGNWATDLSAGSLFGYSLLYIILLSNAMAVVLQYLCLKLGVITQLDLAQACRRTFPFSVNLILYILCEIAIIACDIAEVIGSAIALSLLFGIPISIGVLLTCLDVFVILLGWNSKRIRLFEGLIMLLFFAIGFCFTILLFQTKPDWEKVAWGFIPSSEILTNGSALYIAMGIVGSTVMPHNLYLHSNIVKNRSNRSIQEWGEIRTSHPTSPQLTPISIREEPLPTTAINSPSTPLSSLSSPLEYHPNFSNSNESINCNLTIVDQFWNQETMKHMIKLTSLDSTIALTFALLINSAILIVSAAAFNNLPSADVSDLSEAYQLLVTTIGPTAGYAFAIALLFAGQSSTITGTLAGQICMEGFLGPTIHISPALRRFITRSLAIIPAVLIGVSSKLYWYLSLASYKGEKGINDLLVFSQVILSLQLPFAIWPLIYFTSSKKLMSIQFIKDEEVDLDSESITENSKLLGGFVSTSGTENDSTSVTIDYSNSWGLNFLAYSVGGIITVFNFVLVYQICVGSAM